MVPKLLLLLACSLAVWGLPLEDQHESSMLEDGVEAAYRFVQGCNTNDMVLCLKMRALTFLDREVRRAEDVPLVPGVTLIATEASREVNGRALSESELDASLPQDAEDRDAQVETLLVDRVARFLEGHTLQLKVPDSSISTIRKSLDEARGKKKKKIKFLLPFLLLLKLKAAALIPLALGGLALLALAAFLTGNLALLLSAIIAFKKLFAGKHQTYEVVAHPHYSEEHHDVGHHYGGHYGRSMADPHQTAYNAYKPEKQE